MNKLLTLFLCGFVLPFASCGEDISPIEPPLYSGYRITSVTLNRIPATAANNVVWDNIDGPDVYFSVNGLGHGEVFDNVALPQGLPLVWNLATPMAVTSIATQYDLVFYDKDAANDAIMGSLQFSGNILQEGSRYPSSFVLKSTDGTVEATVNLMWTSAVAF
ncbi:MAG TPA: hypothetical protein VEC36_03185 [Patescibacteria group bacterium]|nr:hypothetical protein [Patescibacteria group bacterium]